MVGFFQFAKEALAAELEKFRNRQFLDATMGASALVAMADGDVNITETNILDQAVVTVQELKIYNTHDAMDLYRDYIHGLRSDPIATREKILQAVSKIRNDSHAAELLIRVCVAISKADDNFNEPERVVIWDLFQALALDPGDLEL